MDTLVISGDGNVINSTNVVGIEKLVLNGTTVTIADLTSLAALQSISGKTTSSEVTITVANGDVVDLTGLALTTLKSITLSGTATTVTLKANAADFDAVAAILKTSGVTTVNLSTDIAGFKALSTADTGINGTKTVTASVADLIANKSSLTGATLAVSGSITGADALALANAGITASSTVSMSVADVITTLQYPDQVAALSGAKLQITGNATYAQYATIIGNTTIASALGAAYSSSTGGYKGVAIVDTTTNLAAAATAINTAITATTSRTVGTAAISGGAALSVSDATALKTITGVTGSYTVSDSASAVNSVITSVSSLPAVLTGAASVSLLSGSRTASTVADALELKALGSKLVGGYDLAISTGDATGSADGLSAVAGATKATLTGTVSVSQLNQILAANSAATVSILKDSPLNLVAGSSLLSAAALDLQIEGTVTTAQANVINPALKTILAKTGAHTAYGLAGVVYTNGYAISDASAAIVSSANATTVKGAKAVTVTNAMSLADATSLRALADASNSDNLAPSALTYSVSDSASTLASALSASSNTTTVSVLAGATVVAATGTATVAQAKILGTTYNSAAQVDSWAISDTVAKLFGSATGTSLVSDVTTAKTLATSLSVQGAVSVAQMTALKAVTNTASTPALIFDNVYAISDSLGALATQTSNSAVPLVAATSITATGTAAVSNLASLKTLNDALTLAGKAAVSYTLSDTYANVVGTSALGSSTATVVATAKSASAITVTGNFTASDTSVISAANLLDLADKAGTANYSVVVTSAATDIATQQAGVLNNSKISKIIASDASLSVSGANTLLAAVGTAVASKVEYNLVDTSANLLATADSGTVLGAKNIQAYDSTTSATQLVSVADAQKLLNLTGASGTVTYSVSDTYANVAANPTVADGASVITVTNSALTAAQYDNLINLGKATSTVTTTVTQKNVSDTAANISSATVQTLAAAGTISTTDVAKVNLTVAQAEAANSGTVWKFATSGLPGGVSKVQIAIVDTAANLLAALANSTTSYTNHTQDAFLLASGTQSNGAQYLVKTSDVATLTAAQMTSLTGITNVSASYNLSDTAGSLTNSSNVVIAGVSTAGSVTVTSSSSDLTTAAKAKAIYDANSKVSFAVITDAATAIGASTGSGSSLVYTYAAAESKASSVVVTGTPSVSQMTAAKAAVGTTPITYSLSDTAENLNTTAGKALLAGATAITLDTSSTAAMVSEAVYLNQFDSKISADYKVAGTAADLVANLQAVKDAAGTSANVSVSSGKMSVAQYTTLKGAFAANLQGNSTTGGVHYEVTDSASAIATYLGAGNTLASISSVAGTFALTADATVTAAQAATLQAASITAVKVVDTAANLLAVSLTGQTSYTVTDTVSLGVASQLFSAQSGVNINSIATTASSFATAYTFNSNAGVAAQKGAMLKAKSLTVDGVAVTLGAKDDILLAGSTYKGKIIGTVSEINALPANIKAAAGYVIVDAYANITAPANTALVAAGSGYIIKDTGDNLTAASTTVLASAAGCLGIEFQGDVSVATASTVLARTNATALYSLADSAANLVPSGSVASSVALATKVTVTGTATTAQADLLFAANTATTVNVVDTGSLIAASSNINKMASIVADSNLSVAGIQAISLTEANTLVRNKAAGASLTFNVDASAADIAAAVTSTSTTAANAATLSAAGTITVTNGASGTAALAPAAKSLATLNITGGYAVSDTAANLTDTSVVGLSDLAKATVVKVVNNATDATYAQAVILEGLANMEKGTGANASKFNIDIGDTAKALASASAAVLDAITSGNSVSVLSYTTALSAAEASSLAAVDAASTNLSTTAAGVIVSDTSANILAPANASAVAAVGSVTVTDTVSVATLSQVKTAATAASSIAYKIADSASNVIVAGGTTVNNATSVQVAGVVTVQDAASIYSFAAATGGVDPTTSNLKYAQIIGTAADLVSANGLATGVTALSKATAVSLTGTATIANDKAVISSGKLVGGYAIADSAAALLAAIGNADKSVLDGATSVVLSSTNTASVSQATVIASQLSNEGALAIQDTASNLNASTASSTVSLSASVIVNGGTGNDNLTNITTSKVTYAMGALANMVGATQTSSAITTGLDVLRLKSGDKVDLSGIADFDAGTGAAAYLTLNANSTLDAAEYQLTRGYLGADGSFVASSSGTDTLLEIGTDSTAGADQVIVLVGVSAVTAVNNGSTGQIVGFIAV